ncbi:hypothetical protein A9Q99_13970 [Gammaproteobacteria bacterium 45_16_T64]|nr:hypothetical protein A9Q99_13970 [Gammaproteobacteria bacterium 45_16_T64]
MIVPKYWSESKTKKVVGGRQFTIKRFGWSDESELEAKKHADSRLNDAVQTLERDGDVRRIDHKTSYNGAEGIPIREEVMSTHQDVVISRNTYGALCLNTPDVLFADIDFEYSIPFTINMIAFVVLLSLASVAALFFQQWFFQTWAAFAVGVVIALMLTSTLAGFINSLVQRITGGQEAKALKRIKQVSSENTALHLRLYRTPMGYRVLVMNDVYSPTSEEAIRLLTDLQSDATYIQMCKNQQCFRARVSPKPWRIGIERLKPNSGVWPIKSERLRERTRWVSIYDKKARSYASCHYLLALGSNKVHKKAEFVRKIHDDMCNTAKSSFDIA